MNRIVNLDRLQKESFDICIIGAGASGAGCALDAALRGYKVALIDKSDFASETSSRSTKLVHGGVRYLEQAFKNLDFAQLSQVKHGLQERHLLIQNAPNLAHPLALITPVSSWIEGLYYSIGLKLYDWIAGNDSLPKSRWLNKKEAIEQIPNLSSESLHSAVQYYDGQLDDARYCLALVQSAEAEGCAVANYVEVIDFIKDSSGKIIKARVNDRAGQQQFLLSASVFVNCTGPFSDTVRLKANSNLPLRLRPSKGVHVILPSETLGGTNALLIPKTPDGRLMFAIPFEGGTLVGTTDTEYTTIEEEAVLEKAEADFLLSTLANYLNKKPSLLQARSGFGGLRPLLASNPAKSTKRLVRDHEVEEDPVSGLVSLLGGKWTTYRLMAKDTIDIVDKILQQGHTCQTDHYVLTGSKLYDPNNWIQLQNRYDLSQETSKHLNQKYGSFAEAVLDLTHENSSWINLLHPSYPFIKAEVIYAVRVEMAITLRDVLARRLRMEITNWQATLDCLSTVSQLIQTELHWSDAVTAQNVDEYRLKLHKYVQDSGIRLT